MTNLLFYTDKDGKITKCVYKEDLVDKFTRNITLPSKEINELFIRYLSNERIGRSKEKRNGGYVYNFIDVDVDEMDSLIDRMKDMKEEEKLSRKNKFKKKVIKTSAFMLAMLTAYSVGKYSDSIDLKKRSEEVTEFFESLPTSVPKYNGEIEINKKGEKLIIENETFRYEEIKLDGVHYDLIANGDIYSQDGTLIYKDKEIVKSFITKDGYYKLTDLYLGKYCLVETKTVGNHVLNKEPYCFEIKYKDQYTDIVSLVINLKNYLGKGDFELTKVDLSTGNPIEGALIEIFTENDELIYSGRTDKDGKIYVKGLESGRKYKFKESEAPEGYILNDKIHEFEIKENGEIVKDTLSNEKIVIDVPNTSANDYKILIPVSLCGLGIILILLSKDKRKKK